MAMSWREAIERVLQEEARALHYSEVSELVLSKGYYKTEGATPDATVNAQITSSIKHEGEKSPFLKVSRGTFALRSAAPQDQSVSEPPVTLPPPTPLVLKEAQTATVEENSDESVIRCLGMYWQRDLVVWKNTPRVFGKQQASSKPVDFGNQRGIYILYDHHTVVYVGRSVDRPLGKRLYEHTIDRLGSRWDRFSWFGLLDVTDDGALTEQALSSLTADDVITTMEALLIEGLEPRQNRKRGDAFRAVEYLQHLDPELAKKAKRKLAEEILSKL